MSNSVTDSGPVIKICGIKTEEEIALMNMHPVSYIGFIFARSKRQLTLEKAERLRRLVRDGLKVVGVFMDNEVPLIKTAIKKCRLDVVQLHGNESDALIQELKAMGVKVWKSIAIKDQESLKNIDRYPSADGVLLDTYHKGATGGTGHVFNWDLVEDLNLNKALILAGGLNPENVIEAYSKVKPDILDLNSGLEVDLIKDEDKVERLFERIDDVYGKEE